ncbi:MAG TPA: LysR family transcriptional regulator [Polyangiaceae bacterium]|jgi:DNA-binding transcriptional LysR family regulator
MTATRDTFAGMAAFLAAVDGGSFSKAATKLGLTPSGVSKLIARLEERLDVQLFHRTTRRIQLTELGTFYFERVRRIFDDVQSLETEIEESRAKPRGLLRVTAPVVLGQIRILPVVVAFRAEFPDVRVDLILADRVVDLIEERIDVAIRMTAAPPMAYVARKLGDDRRLFCASPAYLARRGRPRHPKDLEDHDCLVFYADGAPIPWKLRDKAGKPASVRVCGPLQANNTLALRDAALAGLGIADLPAYLAAEDLRAGRLESVLDDFVAFERAVYAVYPPGRSIPARSREFVRVLAREYTEGDAVSTLRRLAVVSGSESAARSPAKERRGASR